jgi:diguanylate cyclase (GGDEF)-like protein
MNPHNKADDFERQALQMFARRETNEVARIEQVEGRSYYRYMAPVYVEEECLQCHRKQNYAIGDVRGGLSITFDIDELQNKLRLNTFSIVFFGIAATGTLLGLIYFFTSRLIKKLAEARQTIEKIAITDELTGLFNRRHLLSRFVEEFEKARRLGADLGCIIADIDHFKSVNDTHGHLTGDEVLKEVSNRIKDSTRIYDVLGRYGGEEFLILLPDSDLEHAWHFAERVRMHVKTGGKTGHQVTISLGVTSLQQGDQSIDDMIKRADEALYKAKNAGRDRVEWIPGA